MAITTNLYSRTTIQRLSFYLQVLEYIQREEIQMITSKSLAVACNVKSSTLRRDLAYFGKLGYQGVGYSVPALIQFISNILGINREWNCVLVGINKLGKAHLSHREFFKCRFNIVGVFDCDPSKIGTEFADLEVICTSRMREWIAGLNVRIGIITTPPERAQIAANHLVEAGIKGILNYAPARIFVPEKIHVEYVNFCRHLYSLTFNIHTE